MSESRTNRITQIARFFLIRVIPKAAIICDSDNENRNYSFFLRIPVLISSNGKLSKKGLYSLIFFMFALQCTARKIYS